MQRFILLSLFLFIVVCVLVATERQALAYVDPGQGLLVLQSMASAAAACGYFFRRRIKNLFARKDAETEAALPVVAKEGKPADAA